MPGDGLPSQLKRVPLAPTPTRLRQTPRCFSSFRPQASRQRDTSLYPVHVLHSARSIQQQRVQTCRPPPAGQMAHAGRRPLPLTGHTRREQTRPTHPYVYVMVGLASSDMDPGFSSTVNLPARMDERQHGVRTSRKELGNCALSPAAACTRACATPSAPSGTPWSSRPPRRRRCSCSP